MGAVLAALCVSGLPAHEIHRSRAEAEFNAMTKRLEVSLTVFVSDLEVALVRQAERAMSLEKTPVAEFDAQIQLYLGKEFVVSDAGGTSIPHEWVGRKIEAGTEASSDPEVTLYFEIPLPKGLDGVNLRYAVFVDRFKDQLNLLHLRIGSKNSELSFTREAVIKPLRSAL